jgi:hypothetical protein
MSETKGRALLIEIAGFLTLIANGSIATTVHARDEARSLVGKIGATFPVAPHGIVSGWTDADRERALEQPEDLDE